MATAKRERRAYNGGLRVEPPAASRGRAPGQGVGGRSPLKLGPLQYFQFKTNQLQQLKAMKIQLKVEDKAMHPPPAPLESKSVWQKCWRQPKKHRVKSQSSFLIVTVTAKERLQTEIAVERLQHHRPLFRGSHGPMPPTLDPPVRFTDHKVEHSHATFVRCLHIHSTSCCRRRDKCKRLRGGVTVARGFSTSNG